MKIRWFYRLLFTFLPVFVLIISAILTTFFMVLTETAEKEAEQAAGVQARQISAAVDSLLLTIDQHATYELLSNRMFHQFLDASELGNHFLNYEVATRLKDLVVLTSMHSAYLYRQHDKTVITDSGVLALDRFSDKGFVEAAEAEVSSDGWTNPRDYPDYTGATKDRVITLVKHVPAGLGNQGMLIVNVSLNKIQTLFRELAQSNIVNYSLYDRGGKGFFGTKSAPAKDKASLYTSDITGFSVGGAFLQERSFGLITRLADNWLWIVIAIVVLGVLLFVYLIRKSTRPVDAIIDRIKTYAFKKSQLLGTGKDEFQFIESALDKLVEQSQQYEREADEGLRYKKKQFFVEVMEGSFKPEQLDWKMMFSSAGLSADYQKLALIVFEIDRFSDFIAEYNTKDQYLLKFALDNVVIECAQASGLLVWPEWINSNQLAVIAQTKPEQIESSQTVIEGWCELVRKWVEQYLKFTLTIGVGECVDVIEELPLSFESAATALKYKSTLGTNRVIGYWNLDRAESKELFDQVAKIRVIAQQYCTGNEGWEEELQAVFVNLKDNLFSKSEILNIFHYFQYCLLSRITEMSEEYNEIWKKHIQPELSAVLNRFETLQELEERLMRGLRSGAEQLESLRAKRNVLHTMTEVRDFIRERLSDPNLSLQSVSEHFGMTQSTLSRLFKNEFGEKFVDYLARMRMELAKRLLQETEKSVHEIAEEIGYNHAFSFIRVFKKLEGVTPGDYRKSDSAK
ncbi:helix-turn-helix domain-containing protein [Paenibacillus sp. YN15]|uniref:helix-turn-helix domain-containing protein n=1 Tax=Paenibacillus sp. YN15 TaxID=1742774 RepID=UPI000DCCBD56|nr:helix-turn-helix domain-containing protein [Paenibacillus sp. YN15]RAV04993.1 hypothetical protein DQG13_03695 [Paenibacillus sp. YN15]